MPTDKLTLDVLADAIKAINRDARLIVHPDDETMVREALDAIPEALRPELVVSPLVKEPGTAYYSRALPIESIGKAGIVHLPIDGPYSSVVRDAAIAEAEKHVNDYLEARHLIADGTPLQLPDGTIIAGPRAAAYRRIQRNIETRLAEKRDIDPLHFLGGIT